MEDRHETKTILLVDVHKAFLTMLTKEFKKEGYQIITSQSGLEALRVLEDNPDVNLVITDLTSMKWMGQNYYVRSKRGGRPCQ